MSGKQIDSQALEEGSKKTFDQIIFEHQIRDLQVLKGIAKAVDSSFLTDEILHYIYQSLQRIIPFERLSLAVLVENGSAIRAVWARSEQANVHLRIGYQTKLAGTGLEDLIYSGKPHIVNDLERHLTENPDSEYTGLILQEGLRSSLTCPLLVGEQPFGAIFFSSVQKNTYQNAHVQSFQRIASEIAEILSHGYKYEEDFAERQQNNQELQDLLPDDIVDGYSSDQYNAVNQIGSVLLKLAETYDESIKEIQFLAGITHRLNAGLDLDEILDYIYEELHQVIPYQRVGFAVIQEQSISTLWVRSPLPTLHMPAGYNQPLEQTILGDLSQGGRPKLINNLEEYVNTHSHAHFCQLLLKEGFRSSLVCPLHTLGKNVGILFFSCTDPYMYQEEHIEIFEAISEQMATILEKARLYQTLKKERARSEMLLQNMLPPSVAERLKDGPSLIADRFDAATIVFSDIVGFSQWEFSPEELIVFLNKLFSTFDDLCEKHNVTKLRTLGDGYIAVAGVPTPQEDHAHKSAAFALDMMKAAHSLQTPEGAPVELRIGIHSGPVVAGVIGKQTFQYDLWGDTMNLASRMESHGLPGAIQISAATHQLIHSDFRCAKRGRVPMKGGVFHETYLLLESKPDSEGS